MIQRFLTSLLLLAFIAQVFSGAVVIVNYYTNTATFAKNCVNKARPKMHCNGKCQLMKKLQEEERKEQQQQERKAELKIQVLSSKSFYPQLTFYSLPVKTSFGQLVAAKPMDITTDFFHPPSV